MTEYKKSNEIKKYLKSKKRKKRIKKISMITIILTIALILFITKAPIFNIKSIEITGTSKISSDNLKENLNMFIGENIYVVNEEEIKNILKSYIEKHFDIADDKETWFNKMKDLAEENGYAREVKEFKQNPENYKGHVGDISTVIRVALTTRHNTPDLYEIMQVLGKEEVEKRIQSFIS